MYDHILIPVDGSDESTAAARRGLALAKDFDATAEAVHVVEQRALSLTRTDRESGHLREHGESVLADIESLAADIGQSVTTELLEGKPSARIDEYARETDAGLIVLGRQGMTGLGKRLLGGITEQVLHRTAVPVLVVPGAEGTGTNGFDYSRILVPTDGSENANTATRHGAAVADCYDATVHVLNVVDIQAAGGAFNAGGLNETFIERLEDNGRDAVAATADAFQTSAPDSSVETAVTRADTLNGVAAGIREYAATHDIDLVVMGSHGRSNLKRQLLGSVTSQLLRTIDVPVLVTPRPT
ncbi:universal stress protein [Haloarcula sp. CBA1130]|uniref:universal stress protein n=1 Tax=unclassified Haloarcula TaxID=2624677 RepID=UPI0012450F44|nr:MULTISPECIES: universal stress protein [unclassified Haloarcula]KAA9399053.1 universal stress protein [Haloarcula sp. CBA1129]KAA9403567.1 universal stress protein [Haloarcula sp. CBA1130]